MSNIVIPDGGNIGSASDTDAIAISSGGNVTLSQTLDGGAIGSAVTMSANQACVKTALNASGNPPIYACRAWVNFDGTAAMTIGQSYGPSTTPNPIRGSGNVSSITDNGTGDYAVTLTTAMPDTNYSISGASGLNASSNQTFFQMEQQSFGSTSVIDIAIRDPSGNRIDSATVSVQVFR